MAYDDLRFEWISSDNLDEKILQDCSELFSRHYGEWSAAHPTLAGKPITLTKKRLRDYFGKSGGWIALARKKKRLIGYAIVIIGEIPGYGTVTWVTQLVVHRSFRNNKVASRLLRAVWGFSDHFAWGLVTASPFAVRALEKSTRRICDPVQIENHATEILRFGEDHISYIRGRNTTIDLSKSVIDTNFMVDHSDLDKTISRVQGKNIWRMGPLQEGEEWVAFTFRDQLPEPLTQSEFQELMQDTETAVVRAYDSMTMDSNHRWARETKGEVDYFLRRTGLELGARILDFGCGTGRHAIELAKRGYEVIGVDFSASFLRIARSNAAEQKVDNVKFIEDDCRTCSIGIEFDAALCLYDVIGSFPQDQENKKVARNLRRHLKYGGHVMVSVMNYEFTENIAELTGDVESNPDLLLSLPPSSIMQNTGQIFDPSHFMLDPGTRIVYRKEQFNLQGQRLPGELVVRDRRYSRDELIEMMGRSDFNMLECRFVRLGSWSDKEILEATNRHSKEILYTGRAR